MKLPARRLRLAFFGTPDIARIVLERLIASRDADVVLVVSQPDRPRGRGKKVEPTPVKAAAEAHGIEVAQPTKLKDGVLAARIRESKLDLAIVVAYGRILPEDVFLGPEHGTWNVHASLLPRHRGASPIQHTILAGDPEAGVTLMELTAGLDEGPMLLRTRIALTGEETSASLADRLAHLGGETLVEGLGRARSEGLTVTPQDPAEATYAPLLEKSDGLLSLAEPAAALERRIRAMTPWPGAFVIGGDEQPLKITRARVAPPVPEPAPAPGGARASSRAPASRGAPPSQGEGAPGGAQPVPAAPGTVIEMSPRLLIATGEGLLEILELQPPGKRAMPAADFLRGAGRHLQIGAIFPDR